MKNRARHGAFGSADLWVALSPLAQNTASPPSTFCSLQLKHTVYIASPPHRTPSARIPTPTIAEPCEAMFRNQLSEPSAKKAANALCRASARLLVETEHRPARRQAAVTVANLASIPKLCRYLLKSDPPLTSPKRGIVDSLVTLAMLRSKEEKEEEIGTRRECMRALIGLAKLRSTRNMVRAREVLCR